MHPLVQLLQEKIEGPEQDCWIKELPLFLAQRPCWQESGSTEEFELLHTIELTGVEPEVVLEEQVPVRIGNVVLNEVTGSFKTEFCSGESIISLGEQRILRTLSVWRMNDSKRNVDVEWRFGKNRIGISMFVMWETISEHTEWLSKESPNVFHVFSTKGSIVPVVFNFGAKGWWISAVEDWVRLPWVSGTRLFLPASEA